MQQRAFSFITEDAYLDMERASDIKHDYYQGEMFAMAGASRNHNLIVANVIGELRSQLKKKPCRVYPRDMRLKVDKAVLYTYPDVMAVCGDEKFDDHCRDMLLNPDVIIEVLSDSTESYDRGLKFQICQTIHSLKEYVLISQNRQKFRKNENGIWEFSETDESNPSIDLDSARCILELSEVYDKV
jgi:Uma2 family endonuclease